MGDHRQRKARCPDRFVSLSLAPFLRPKLTLTFYHRQRRSSSSRLDWWRRRLLELWRRSAHPDSLGDLGCRLGHQVQVRLGLLLGRNERWIQEVGSQCRCRVTRRSGRSRRCGSVVRRGLLPPSAEKEVSIFRYTLTLPFTVISPLDIRDSSPGAWTAEQERENVDNLGVDTLPVSAASQPRYDSHWGNGTTKGVQLATRFFR